MIRRWTPTQLVLLAGLLFTRPALATTDCPGHTDALGTSRTLVVDPRAHPRIGAMQYAQTLPLRDKEVVLTFDDGPLPRYSDQVLDILAAECVKATFFVVGVMAQDYPNSVRKLRDAGHTVGTHTQHHPMHMKRMGIAAARIEIDDGIAATTAALDGQAPAPFFRIPGLSRAEATEDYAAELGLQVWSADVPADDWRHISPDRVRDLAIDRIDAKGKGILLLHDIQPRTVAALPMILRDLKAKGYHIVQVVPARDDLPATPTDPQQWQTHQTIVAATQWPAVPDFVFASSETLSIPAMPQAGFVDGALMLLPESFDRVKRPARGASIDTPWLEPSSIASISTGAADLPIPGESLFQMPDTTVLPTLAAAKTSKDKTRLGSPDIEASAARDTVPGSPQLSHRRLGR